MRKWRTDLVVVVYIKRVFSQFLTRYGVVDARFGRRQTIHSCGEDGQREDYDYSTESDTFQRCTFNYLRSRK